MAFGYSPILIIVLCEQANGAVMFDLILFLFPLHISFAFIAQKEPAQPDQKYDCGES